jgi:hypothetical protein
MSTSEHPDQDDVQGHSRAWSDETLKQAVTKVQDALADLRQLETAEGGDDEVQGHGWMKPSDEQLKQAIIPLERALVALRKVETVSS